MTASVVAVVTESRSKAAGSRLGFNSNGRYAQHGLLNERFIKRVSGPSPNSCWTPTACSIRPNAGRR